MSLAEIEASTIFKGFFAPGDGWIRPLESETISFPDAIDNKLGITGLAETITKTFATAKWNIVTFTDKMPNGDIRKCVGFDLVVGDAEKELELRYIADKLPILFVNVGGKSILESDHLSTAIKKSSYQRGAIVFELSHGDRKHLKMKNIQIFPKISDYNLTFFGDVKPPAKPKDTQPPLF